MSAAEGLRRIVRALGDCGIEYMLAGSHASGLHGIPRATQDFDIVTDPHEESLRRLVAKLVAEEFYADETAALDALRRRAMFNVVDEVTGWKTDFEVLPRDAFSRAQWERRQAASVLGFDVVAATAEDTVLAKLVWTRREVVGMSQAPYDKQHHPRAPVDPRFAALLAHDPLEFPSLMRA